jgi:hypothetical protein
MSSSFLDAVAQRVADGGRRRRREPFDVFVRQEGKRETGGCAFDVSTAVWTMPCRLLH